MVHSEKESLFLVGSLNLGKVHRYKQSCSQIHHFSDLLQSQGSRSSPKAQGQQKKSSWAAGGPCLHPTGEKQSQVGTQPGSLPCFALHQEHEHRWYHHHWLTGKATPVEPQSLTQYAIAFCFWPSLQWVPCSFSGLQFAGSRAFLVALHFSRCFCFL